MRAAARQPRCARRGQRPRCDRNRGEGGGMKGPSKREGQPEGQPDLQTTYDQVQEILGRAKLKSDLAVWTLALAMVAIAGKRASDTGNKEVEDACKDFVQAMHV